MSKGEIEAIFLLSNPIKQPIWVFKPHQNEKYHLICFDEDFLELWKRVVFNVVIKDTDDHLRNHGFLLSKGGWLLSPSYDVNPVYFGRGVTLNITEMDNALDLNLALSVAHYFRLRNELAKNIVDSARQIVSTWKELAKK